MGFEFNPLKIAEDATKAVADAADGAMHTVEDVVEGAAKTVADVAGAAGDAVASISAPKPKAPCFRYTGVIRPGTRMITKILYVSVMSLDAKGEPLEGRRQALSLSSKGVRLHVSDSALSAVQCEIPAGNCLLFKNGVTENGNPILEALIFVGDLARRLVPLVP